MAKSTPHKTLRLILGDQLNPQHSWFQEIQPHVEYVFMEVRSETDYVQHHIQKVCAIFLAMRSFAAELQHKGHQVRYVRLNDSENQGSLAANIEHLLNSGEYSAFAYQLPDEYRVDQDLKSILASGNVDISVVDTEHFYTTRKDFKSFFEGKKQYLMEFFYRQLRKKFDILMIGSKPLHDRWNFDEDNRKTLPKNIDIPPPILFENHAAEVLSELKKAGIQTIGKIVGEMIHWPVTRQQAEETLAYFIEFLLPHFGTYEDAMTTESWAVFHSRLSFALNIKLLSPKEVIDKAIDAHSKRPDQISFNQLEGFVRQILGWREYMRGIYWAHMPEFRTLNFFNHKSELPSWFWTGKTEMNCLKHCIGQSIDHAYAHHIQRLMITGNFALLGGIHPDAVDSWYLGIYIDAFEWVEITNTRGMSQYADGGIVGSKPYVCSASYISKMSNYCQSCRYKKKEQIGPDACPFNSLYWHFHHRNRTLLEKNPRIGMVYRTWDRMTEEKQSGLLEQANWILTNMEAL
jgi:deoxyribodipyrimidine photolyase-related protein